MGAESGLGYGADVGQGQGPGLVLDFPRPGWKEGLPSTRSETAGLERVVQAKHTAFPPGVCIPLCLTHWL